MKPKATMNTALFWFASTSKCQTRMTGNRAYIIDHIFASYPEKITQQGIIDGVL